MKMRMAIQQIGMALLLMLMITVIVNDVGRLFGN
jgi:membrane-associated protease RseP (regulator of RpoE activity)